MSEQQPSAIVQGMYCQVNDTGTQKCTVTLSDVSLTVYRVANIFTFDMNAVRKTFNSISQHSGATINRAKYDQDFKDLLAICAKVQCTKMRLRSGDTLHTYTVGEPLQDEVTGFLELSPEREEWWSHPNLEPVVSSLQSYLPEFCPWRLQNDHYIRIFSRRSSLL